MVTERQGPLLVSAIMLATAIVMGAIAASAVPESPAVQPSHRQIEVTVPPAAPEHAPPLANEQKNTDGPLKNEKNDKKKGPMAGMMLTLFAVITGHQGATR